MDLTFFTGEHKTTHAAIDHIEHRSRLVLRLHVLTRQCSWCIWGHLFMAIAKHGCFPIGQIALFRLRVDQQLINWYVVPKPVGDHSNPAALAAPRQRVAQLTDCAAHPEDVTSYRVLHQDVL